VPFTYNRLLLSMITTIVSRVPFTYNRSLLSMVTTIVESLCALYLQPLTIVYDYYNS